MPDSRLEELEALAAKATPGEWRMWAGSGWPKWWAEYLGAEDDDTRSGWPLAATEEGRAALVEEDGYDELWLGVMRRSRDQAFVAACSPDVVAALVRELRGARDALREVAKPVVFSPSEIEEGSDVTRNLILRGALRRHADLAKKILGE